MFGSPVAAAHGEAFQPRVVVHQMSWGWLGGPVPLGVVSKVAVSPGCWLWTGALDSHGYGRFKVPGDKQRPAHRVVFEALVGPIPEGKELDHLCRVPRCVRPEHLQPVPHRTNVVRGIAPAAANAHKTNCIRGHAFDVSYTPKGHAYPRRACRTCAHINYVRRVATIPASERRSA